MKCKKKKIAGSQKSSIAVVIVPPAGHLGNSPRTGCGYRFIHPTSLPGRQHLKAGYTGMNQKTTSPALVEVTVGWNKVLMCGADM